MRYAILNDGIPTLASMSSVASHIGNALDTKVSGGNVMNMTEEMRNQYGVFTIQTSDQGEINQFVTVTNTLSYDGNTVIESRTPTDLPVSAMRQMLQNQLHEAFEARRSRLVRLTYQGNTYGVRPDDLIIGSPSNGMVRIGVFEAELDNDRVSVNSFITIIKVPIFVANDFRDSVQAYQDGLLEAVETFQESISGITESANAVLLSDMIRNDEDWPDSL